MGLAADTSKGEQFRRGIEELEQEGVPRPGTAFGRTRRRRTILAAVGPLQFTWPRTA